MAVSKGKDAAADGSAEALSEPPICFAIMPIADVDSYNSGHFDEVYENIVCPAAQRCGYAPIRADQVNATNLIQLDILRKIVDAPMAICDLSSANPNVLFELGLRQAFDLPVVLLKDKITRKIFDIDSIRTIYYDANLRPRVVQSTVDALTRAIVDTRDADPEKTMNSLVRLLGLQAAALQRSDEDPSAARMTLIENSLASVTATLSNLTAGVNQLVSGKTRVASYTTEIKPSSLDASSIVGLASGVLPSPVPTIAGNIVGLLSSLSPEQIEAIRNSTIFKERKKQDK